MDLASGAPADKPKHPQSLARNVYAVLLAFLILILILIAASGFFYSRFIPNNQGIIIGTIVVLLITIVLFAVLSFLLYRFLVSPALYLAETSKQISAGDLSLSPPLQRTDEFGFVSSTIHQLAQKLQETSLTVGETSNQPGRLLETASEIAQHIVATNDGGEVIQRAAQLLVDRFNYLYVSIYLLDSSRNTAVLQAEAARKPHTTSFIGAHIRVGAYSIIGWVLANNQPRAINNPEEEKYFQEIHFPGTNSQAAIPIQFEDTILGVLNIQSDELNAFDPNKMAILQMIAGQVAVGLQNIHNNSLQQENQAGIGLLNRELVLRVSQAHSEAEILSALTDILGKAPFVSGIYSVEKILIRVLSIIDPGSVSQQNSAAGISLPIMNIIPRLSEGKEIYIENIHSPGEFDNLLTFFDRRGCVSAVIFPILEDNELSKIVILGARDSQSLTPSAIQPFTILFSVAANSLTRFRILKILGRTESGFQALTKVSQALSVETDLHKLYARIHGQVTDALGKNLEFAVTIYNRAAEMIEIPYMSEGPQVMSLEPFPAGSGFTSQVLKSRSTLLINNNALRRAEEMGAKLVGDPARSWLGVPLILSGELIGALVVQDLVRENRFSEDNVTLLETIAPQVAVSIRNTQLIAEMQAALSAYDQERFLLNVLLDNIPDLVYFKNREGKFIRSSRSFAVSRGLESPELVVGKTQPQLPPQPRLAAAAIASTPVLSDRELGILASSHASIGQIESIDQDDGSKAWIQSTIIPMINREDEVIGLLGIHHELTAMKHAQETAQKNSQQLRIAAEVARDATSSLEIDELLNKAVNLIRNRFEFYHASIFLIDSTGTYLLLRESTGEAGQQMKQANHRLGVGSRSIVGQAAFRSEPVVSNQVTQDSTYYANPLLPNTRAELAIPLLIGDRVQGVLDVQSAQENAFSAEDIDILQVLADQLAVAVFNAQLFARAQQNLARHRLIHEITTSIAAKGSTEEVLMMTTQGLVSALPNHRIALFLTNDHGKLEIRASVGYEGINLGSRAVTIGDGPVGTAAGTLSPILIKDFNSDSRFIPLGINIRSQVAVPIQYSSQLMGVLSIESPVPGAFDETDLEIIATLGNSLGAVLSNAQLIGEIRRQVDRQQAIFEATSRIRRSADIEMILKTSAEEICMVLGANRARIQIEPEIATPPLARSDFDDHNNGRESSG
jgi:GAF domain-containing protein/HAMP domain-containing protein